MTARRVRTVLRAPLREAGFAEEGTQFVHRTAELQHRIEVAGVRRMAGFVQLHHHIALADEPNAWLTEELASHRLGSPYPRIWAAASLDAGLVLDQALAIRNAFRTARDVAHFCSDRPHLAPPRAPSPAVPGGSPASLPGAETSHALARLGRDILGPTFHLTPRTDT